MAGSAVLAARGNCRGGRRNDQARAKVEDGEEWVVGHRWLWLHDDFCEETMTEPQKHPPAGSCGECGKVFIFPGPIACSRCGAALGTEPVRVKAKGVDLKTKPTETKILEALVPGSMPISEAWDILAKALRENRRELSEARALAAEITKGLGEVLVKLDRARRT